MGRIVVFGSNKGGVGKTTTSVNFAVMLVVQYSKSVIILRCDKNPELPEWNEKRVEAGLTQIPLYSAYGKDTYKEINRLSRMCDVLIVDCPGHDSAEFRSALSVADILITLVKPSSDFEKGTLREVTETVRTIQDNGNPKLQPWVLLTRVKPQKVADAIALDNELRSHEVWIQPLKTRLSDLDVYESACNLGAGVHEITRASSLTKAKALLELMAQEIKVI
ncbi:ParA family protein [Buttiauxella sp. B2]|uniref:ParA family protein n=1 Tax=Buttiauxella sp. B2 TaxID=2587812 RepID=UPI00111D63B1|nr:ParA family protein [Buttiauxella sp. B2]TNV16127.1 ParA family protein [Buttiauxella sp. B2]